MNDELFVTPPPSDKKESEGWDAFQKTGLLWWANRMLHLFGWAIFLVVDEKDRIVKAVPKRTKFRGFDEEQEHVGFTRLTNYINTVSKDLKKDIEQ